MRDSPGSADSAGNSKRIGETGIFQARDEIGDQFMLAAVKMRAAADVEQQSVGRVAGHQWCVAQTPVGNGLEQGSIGLSVFGYGIDTGMHGARLRQREAGREAEPLGRIIDGGQDFSIAALAGDDQRRGSFMRPCDAVGREPAQPQAEHALRG